MGLEEIQDELNLAAPPYRIECYDISNTQGTNSVGAMVVFEAGPPQPGEYRRFKIKTVEGPNDFSRLQGMLRRRFRRQGPRDKRKVQHTHETEPRTPLDQALANPNP